MTPQMRLRERILSVVTAVLRERTQLLPKQVDEVVTELRSRHDEILDEELPA
jgi:hypothetical protein